MHAPLRTSPQTATGRAALAVAAPAPRPPLSLARVAVLCVLPPVAAVLVAVHAATHGFSAATLGVSCALWAATGLGVTAGYHRLFTHRAWSAPAPVRAVLAVLGATALENHAMAWASDHRRHHAYSDTPADPYGVDRGFWHAHLLWALRQPPAEDLTNVRDLAADPVCAWQRRRYGAIAAAGLALPALALGLWTGDLAGAAILLAARIAVVHHTTFLINSACHLWGRRPWSRATSARDNRLVALVTFGEGYHNFHHAHPTDYRNGPRWYDADPTKWAIWALSRVGGATRLRRARAVAGRRAPRS